MVLVIIRILVKIWIRFVFFSGETVPPNVKICKLHLDFTFVFSVTKTFFYHDLRLYIPLFSPR